MQNTTENIKALANQVPTIPIFMETKNTSKSPPVEHLQKFRDKYRRELLAHWAHYLEHNKSHQCTFNEYAHDFFIVARIAVEPQLN